VAASRGHMHLRFSAFAAVALPLVAAAQENFPLSEAQECRARGGLPHFFAKAGTVGAEVKVAYLGGSITAQAGWRPKTLALFQATYPAAKFSEINAAIGGTGSDLGVFRVRQDVLDQQPDLLFVEFAVNDGGAQPAQIERCMEGIVRQTWRLLPNCDICFVYTVTEALHAPMLEGKFPRAASVMERVADHYGIPSIHMAMEVAALAKMGRLVWKGELPKTDAGKQALGDRFVFAPDGVHPHPETGHELYLAAISRSLPMIAKAGGSTAPHSLGEPLIATNYEAARMMPIGELALSGFERVDPKTSSIGKSFLTRLPALHRGDKPGSTISFRFKGTRAAIYDVIGPDCGQVTVTLDDQAPMVRPRFDGYCNYHRLATLVIGTELPDEVHTVKIEIHPEQPDKAKILGARNLKMEPAEKFEGTAFYPGALMLVGEVVK
jgi:lysophospholipase L1-like esterase